eukprot:gb/GEZN01024730.1/.p2 GENE.gb/GEZN01024730.1/~~gb/GEZN01024730.1/.p2  ORF type:complete len:130 (-),score=28.96 gb/GEZN01024730.1/:171-512(-)
MSSLVAALRSKGDESDDGLRQGRAPKSVSDAGVAARLARKNFLDRGKAELAKQKKRALARAKRRPFSTFSMKTGEAKRAADEAEREANKAKKADKAKTNAAKAKKTADKAKNK